MKAEKIFEQETTDILEQTVKMSFRANISEWKLKNNKKYNEDELAQLLDEVFVDEGLMVRESGRYYTNKPYQSMEETYKAFERVVNKLIDKEWFYGYYTDKGICVNRGFVFGDEHLIFPYFKNVNLGEYAYSGADYTTYHAPFSVYWRKDIDKGKLKRVKDNFSEMMIDSGFQIYEGAEEDATHTLYTEPCIDIDYYLENYRNYVSDIRYKVDVEDTPDDENKEKWIDAFINTYREKCEFIMNEYIWNDEFMECVTSIERWDKLNGVFTNGLLFLNKRDRKNRIKVHPQLEEGSRTNE